MSAVSLHRVRLGVVRAAIDTPFVGLDDEGMLVSSLVVSSILLYHIQDTPEVWTMDEEQ
jgi:hypothetical protein